jgi:predicted acyltransferase
MLIAMHPGPGQHDPAQLRHPEWHGLTFVDLFFPLFLFVVGISMTLSPRADDVRHVLRRAAILVVLGIGLASLKHERFGLTGVLQHIAGAYLLAFAVLRAPRRWHAPLAAAIVGVVWAGFVVWAWGDDPWGQSGTLAHAVDTALLGGFTSEGTLQTVISAATVVGGSLAGRLIQDIPDPRRLAGALALRAGALLGLALVLSLVVPINKRLWTPSFTVLTLATSWALLAAGVRLVDASGRRRWVAPLVHLGANPIAIYVLFMASLALLRNYGTALTPELTVAGSPMIGALVYATGWATLWWLFAYLLYRHRVHIKI